jgi:hypothetical protein
MALKPKITTEDTVVEPVVEPIVEATVEPTVESPKSVKVMAVQYKQRHPVTGVLFNPGVPVDIIDLDDAQNAFVRHQIEAGVFKIV